MSSQSPSSVLYDSNGVALAVYNNTSLVASQPAVLFAGSDGYNTRNIFTTNYGAQFNTQASTNVVVFNNGTISANGSMLIENSFLGSQQINLIVNVSSAPTGTLPTLVFTLQELDPGDEFTVFGTPASTVSITGTGVFTAVLTNTHSSSVRVSWTIGGTGGPTFTGVYATIVTKSTPDTQAISGSITANNASVGTDGAAALGFDTQIGGVVSASDPTYTAGNLDALSLTTSGRLRTDVTGTVTANQGGSWTVTANQGTSPWVTSVSGTVAVTQSTSPWVISGTVTANAGTGNFNNASVGTDGAAALGFDTQVGGRVTQAAPSYTAGNLDALSLDLFGNLRTLSDGYVTTSAPSYTNNSPAPLSLDTSGNLRVTGFITTNKAASSAVTSVAQATSNTVILSSNANRIFASIYNNSGQKMFIKLGTTANTTTSYSIQLMPNSYWEVPNDWTGEIDAIWSGNGSGNALVTELSP